MTQTMDKDTVRQMLIEKIVRLIDEVPMVSLTPGSVNTLKDGTKISNDEIIQGVDAKARLTLSAQHKIIVEHDDTTKKPVKVFKRGATVPAASVTASAPAAPTSGTLQYFVPPFYSKLLLNLRCGKDWSAYCSKNLLFYGHKGAGKTSCVRKLAMDCGFDRVFQQNGTRDMTSSTFLGSPTLLIDETSMQSYVSFKKGPLYLAMIHGTETDTAGNQILYNSKGERVYDDSGRPKVTGAPALYFLDEFSVVLPEVLTSVFNRALETPDNPGDCRSLEISEDGGRVVKGHPGFAVVFGSNLLGKGIESDAQAGYTGQNNQHDDSTLDRIDAVYEFGYNLDAEKNIMSKLLVNDKDVDRLVKFTDKIRKEWSLATVETLFSTRQLLQLCKQIRLYRDGQVDDPVGAAFYDTVFASLRDKERMAWNQSVSLLFNVDVLKRYENINSQSIHIPRRAQAQVI